MTAPTSPLSSGLISAIKKAGALALDHFGTSLKVDTKSDGSKVTSADYAVNHLLESELRPLDKNIAWLSEESPVHKDRLSANRIWIIDPIDGTSSYLNEDQDWCIVAALVEKGIPILGAVYNPLSRELYFAEKHKGATLNERPLKTSPVNSLDDAVIISSKGHFNRTFQQEGGKPDRFWRCSMAYRIALVAAGKAEATISLTPKSDWDIAASHLILEEAGGKISTPDGSEIIYNKPLVTHKGIVASNNALYTEIISKTAVARPLQSNVK